MKKVLIRAPLLSQSGYGNHSRQVYRWLETIPNIKISTEILSWGNTPWLINPDHLDGMVGRIMSSSSQDSNFDISILSPEPVIS